MNDTRPSQRPRPRSPFSRGSSTTEREESETGLRARRYLAVLEATARKRLAAQSPSFR